MKTISGLMGKVPSITTSHNRAYAKIWESLLRSEIVYDTDFKGTKDDTIFLYLGINHKPDGLNLFGGLDDKLYESMNNFINSEAKFFTLDYPMPDFKEHFIKRLPNKTTYSGWTEEFLDALTEKCKGIETITMRDMVKDKLVIGDSHSLSVTPGGTPVFRLDAKTLHGALKDDFIEDMIPETVKYLTLQFGSVDLRHHLFRQNDPYSALETLCLKYLLLITKLESKGIKVEVHSPVPIELEERKMAGTTLYKKTPFTGSREDRLKMTLMFIKLMRNYIGTENVAIYPKEWYSMDPGEYASKIMEGGENLPGKGIHVGFPHYRMNNFGLLSVN